MRTVKACRFLEKQQDKSRKKKEARKKQKVTHGNKE
jgi:hypothetical protein